MIKELFLKLKNYPNKALNAKEKVLFKLAGLLILFLVADRFIIIPFQDQNAFLSDEIRKHHAVLAYIKSVVVSGKERAIEFKGKDSDFISILKDEIKKSNLKTVLLSPREARKGELFLKFELNGPLGGIMGFIQRMENTYHIRFKTMDLKIIRSALYSFEGSMQI